MDKIWENLLLANIKGSYMIFKKSFWPILKIFFILRSLKTTQNNRSSPHGPMKKIFPQCLII